MKTQNKGPWVSRAAGIVYICRDQAGFEVSVLGDMEVPGNPAWAQHGSDLRVMSQKPMVGGGAGYKQQMLIYFLPA